MSCGLWSRGNTISHSDEWSLLPSVKVPPLETATMVCDNTVVVCHWRLFLIGNVFGHSFPYCYCGDQSQLQKDQWLDYPWTEYQCCQGQLNPSKLELNEKLAYWPILKRIVVDLSNVVGCSCFHVWYRCEVIVKDNMVLWADISSGWVVDTCNTSGMKQRVSKIYTNIWSWFPFWWSNWIRVVESTVQNITWTEHCVKVFHWYIFNVNTV